jgi:hypothetical protein
MISSTAREHVPSVPETKVEPSTEEELAILDLRMKPRVEVTPKEEREIKRVPATCSTR